MGPREQDNDTLLLITVLVVSSVVALGASLMEATPSIAKDSGQPRVASYQTQADEKPIRVIVPFHPNINPGAR